MIFRHVGDNIFNFEVCSSNYYSIRDSRIRKVEVDYDYKRWLTEEQIALLAPTNLGFWGKE